MKQCNFYKLRLFFYLSITVFLLLIVSCKGSSILYNLPIDVYVGGRHDDSAVYWKNGEMVTLSTKYSGVTSIAIVGGDVYASGSILLGPMVQDDYGIPVAGYWKNGKRIVLGNPKYGPKYGSGAAAIFVFGDDVYVGGYIDGPNTSVAGYWKNGKWMGFNARGGYSPVRSIVVVPRPAGQ